MALSNFIEEEANREQEHNKHWKTLQKTLATIAEHVDFLTVKALIQDIFICG